MCDAGGEVWVGPDGTALTGVHPAYQCQGRGCVVHHPSAHHMRDWPVVWRDDRGLLTAERVCGHGIGHPDPDDLAWHVSHGNGWAASHGCDGCCVPASR